MTVAVASQTGLPGVLREDGYELPANLSFERWLSIGETLQQMDRSVQWWLGDWWNYGERHYGEMAAQATKDLVKDTTGYAYSTVNKAGWVARKFEDVRRRIDVPWSHHAEVAALEPLDQDRLLGEAVDLGLTRYELREAVRVVRDAERAEAMVGTSAPACAADQAWAPTAEDLTDEARRALDFKAAEVGRRHAVGFAAGWIQALRWNEARDCFTEWRD